MNQPLNIGTLLDNGKYRIERVLGEGGFGITYLVREVMLNKLRAIKEFFPREYCMRENGQNKVIVRQENAVSYINRLKRKFIREAVSIANLDYHPGVIKIHSVFEENDTAYYVMDYIDGISVTTLVENAGSINPGNAIECITKVGEALIYVHSHGINHLDIRPDNIIIRKSDKQPIIIDFGLTKQFYDTKYLENPQFRIGLSPGFSPLEQHQGESIANFSPQNDVYSLAATLFYMLTGTLPPDAVYISLNGISFPNDFPNKLKAPIAKAMATSRVYRHESIKQFIDSINPGAIPNDVSKTEHHHYQNATQQPPVFNPTKQDTQVPPAFTPTPRDEQTRQEGTVQNETHHNPLQPNKTPNDTSGNETQPESHSNPDSGQTIPNQENTAETNNEIKEEQEEQKPASYPFPFAPPIEDEETGISAYIRNHPRLVTTIAITIGVIGLAILAAIFVPKYDSAAANDDEKQREYVENLDWDSPFGKAVYSGTVDQAGKPDGKGAADFTDGDYAGNKYEGEFTSGNMQGRAKYTLSNGDTFEGSFDDNKFVEGVYTYTDDGMYYVGSFKDGMPDQGTYYNSDGSVYSAK